MGCLSYDPSVNPEKKLVSRNGYSVEKKNNNKMETVLLTHLQRVTLLPTGSYGDDDILTEAPRGHSRLHRFSRLGAGDFCFGASSGEI